MKRKIILALGFIVCLAVFFPPGSFAQSSFLRRGINGAMVDGFASLNIKNGEIDAGTGTFGGRIGYSIGGILDVGAAFSVGNGEIEGCDLYDSNVAIRYGLMLAKQDPQCPVSLELSGEYGFDFIESGYFTDQNLQKDGHGYFLQLSLQKDLLAERKSILRFGIFGKIRNYSYTTRDTQRTTDEARESSPERSISSLYGVSGTFGWEMPRGRSFYITFEPAMNEDFEYRTVFSTGMVFQTH